MRASAHMLRRVLNVSGHQFNARHMITLMGRNDYSDLRARAIRELSDNGVDHTCEVKIILMIDILVSGKIISDTRVNFQRVSLSKTLQPI